MASQADLNLPRIRACLFDMDGLLIDSEDIYTNITNEILRQFGKPKLPWSVKAQLQGRPAPEAYKIFADWSQIPLDRQELGARQASLQEEHFPKCQPLPGVETLLKNLRAAESTDRPVYIALATSSHNRNYELKTTHLQHVFSLFPDSRRVLGDDPRIGPGRGKPLPDIYLLALETINVEVRKKGEPEIKPEECLVFEDAVAGVEAGRRAGMRVVWCPHPGLLEAYKGREAEVLAGLTGQHKEEEKSEPEREAESLQESRVRGAGKPGELNDGWAELLLTLEDFPYGKYGIQVP
ncbi:hypothetical protein MPDQ_006708 [Monascus purpureus]|uniref:HAD superfamily hydrolase n=1 Tax=Monascus purpureus TaxID=5098 RepID=A0A507QVS4_MONPU|nr:hypothetical protein MPDQ_006708 [Monascus purpureus]BDD62282.1 hypothetical protein MAP00_007256 [Monascus purpureus]